MFTVEREQRQYETYILGDSASQSRVEIIPERGGIVTQWQTQGQQLLYLDHERLTHPDLTVRGGIPILFPICGNLPGDRYTHNAQTYPLKQHGFARNLPWRVVEQTTEACAALTVALTHDATTQAMYPFSFQVQLTYELLGNTLTIHPKITNHSPETMPFSLGFHPYFAVPFPIKNDLQIDIPGTTLWDHKTRTSQLFTGFDFEQAEIDIAFRPLTGSVATVTQGNFSLHLAYDTPFTTLVFWTVVGKDFYCLEPWTAPRYALTQGDDLIQLAPSGKLTTWVKFTCEIKEPRLG